MKPLRFKSHQQGNFTVEFAIVGVFFALLLVFSADIIIKLSVKGKLERMTVSAANIIKERTELFGEDDFEVGSAQAEEAYTIVKNSLTRTMSNFDSTKFGFALHVRQGVGETDEDDQTKIISQWSAPSGTLCQAAPPSKDLSFTTTFGRPATLYQVTLCYDTENWYGNLIGEDFSRVSSRAVVMGR
ncbi:tight adherence pilus pseudopilin TadF [Salinivibrio sharmensis]|uniref:tight adherence pilus pseudopilin TadF n=1 Tax=Salinivibrio sharmensis TaxID=390883 RepID=UPI00098B7F6C|nr:tight adherence pilus pseudopilin TadF [Salinivibrio sharmensis]